MKRLLATLAILCGTGLATAAAGCGDERSGDGGSGNAAGATTTTTAAARDSSRPAPATTSRRRGKTVKVIGSDFGQILGDGRGHALYLFTREKGTRSRCYGGCADAWPPLLTRGKPRAGSGAEKGLLGTTRRRDGRTQVTYRGHPLYFYVGDRKPGQVLCQDVVEFGGTWLVVEPDGDAVR